MTSFCCPKCHHGIDVLDDTPGVEVECERCGTRFRLTLMRVKASRPTTTKEGPEQGSSAVKSPPGRRPDDDRFSLPPVADEPHNEATATESEADAEDQPLDAVDDLGVLEDLGDDATEDHRPRRKKRRSRKSTHESEPADPVQPPKKLTPEQLEFLRKLKRRLQELREKIRGVCALAIGVGLLFLAINLLLIWGANRYFPLLMMLTPPAILIGLGGVIDPRIYAATLPELWQFPFPIWCRILGPLLLVVGFVVGLILAFMPLAR